MRKNDETWNGPSSYCTIIAYGPYGGDARSCSFNDTSTLSVVSILLSVGLTLSPRIGVSVDELLRVTSDATLSVGLCIDAKVTVCLSFAFRFSPQIVSWTPLRKLNSPADSSVVREYTYLWLQTTVASSVLN